MILIFEQTFAKPRIPQEKWFFFRPRWFRARSGDKMTWRLAWGFWSISYYQHRSLPEFFRYVEQGNSRWQDPH
jgi:hypothetical protein